MFYFKLACKKMMIYSDGWVHRQQQQMTATLKFSEEKKPADARKLGMLHLLFIWNEGEESTTSVGASLLPPYFAFETAKWRWAVGFGNKAKVTMRRCGQGEFCLFLLILRGLSGWMVDTKIGQQWTTAAPRIGTMDNCIGNGQGLCLHFSLVKQKH